MNRQIQEADCEQNECKNMPGKMFSLELASTGSRVQMRDGFGLIDQENGKPPC